MTAETITTALGGVRNGAGFLVHCPVPGHGRGRGDRAPSLSIRDGDDGRLLVRCFAGCDSLAVLSEISNPSATKYLPPSWAVLSEISNTQAPPLLRRMA